MQLTNWFDCFFIKVVLKSNLPIEYGISSNCPLENTKGNDYKV